MLKKTVLLVVFLIASTQLSQSQSLQNLKDINQVWAKFYQAFETLDHQPMAEIHAKELIRIAGGRSILNYKTYITSYKDRFKASKVNNDTNNISLRFFERINSDDIASERGIFKLIRNKDKPNEQTYYGQFHVIIKKLNGTWKITMDYDSTEFDTIGEADFKKARAMTDFDSFVKQ
ncbi:MAG: hypothetical protein V7719_04485 [Psychroserpens sp.]|uniref:DUF4440 domain-containing protein n=1 Tax=Psychroserpens sp. TaxID=2020870 RepID=UPI00300360F2